VSISARFICYSLLLRNERKGIKETGGNGTKGYSPSIALVPTYLIGNENQSSVVRKEFGETYARQASHLCLRISLARENQSAVVRLTTGCAFCLFVFFRLDNADVLAQVLLLAAWRLTCYRLAVEHEEAYPYVEEISEMREE